MINPISHSLLVESNEFGELKVSIRAFSAGQNKWRTPRATFYFLSFATTYDYCHLMNHWWSRLDKRCCRWCRFCLANAVDWFDLNCLRTGNRHKKLHEQFKTLVHATQKEQSVHNMDHRTASPGTNRCQHMLIEDGLASASYWPVIFLIVYEPRCESVANLSTIASNSAYTCKRIERSSKKPIRNLRRANLLTRLASSAVLPWMFRCGKLVRRRRAFANWWLRTECANRAVLAIRHAALCWGSRKCDGPPPVARVISSPTNRTNF